MKPFAIFTVQLIKNATKNIRHEVLLDWGFEELKIPDLTDDVDMTPAEENKGNEDLTQCPKCGFEW